MRQLSNDFILNLSTSLGAENVLIIILCKRQNGFSVIIVVNCVIWFGQNYNVRISINVIFFGLIPVTLEISSDSR